MPGRIYFKDLLVCLGLGLVTLILYLPLRDHDFIHLDDHQYVTENPHVSRGLTPENLAWAFTHFHAANWHPLTWISLMLDAELYGLNPGGFLATNVLLHITATLLLFIALRQLNAGIWRSAAVAGLFAWHPLHVESVAWIAERKDVLSAVFWMLTICLYIRYVKQKSRGFYILTLAAFAVGLLAKPMLVTLPCVLLLLDYWPLGRFGGSIFPPGAPPSDGGKGGGNPGCTGGSRLPGGVRGFLGLVVEKLPLLLLSIASSIVTVAAQKNDSAFASLDRISFTRRVGHSLTAYVDYLTDTVWPGNLAVYYPYPTSQTAAEILLAAGVLAIITWLAVRLRQSQPWAIVGWLWYLGTLVPVIGLAQVGLQASADRYTYIPLIGIFIAAIWSGAAVVERLRLPPIIGRVTAGAALIGCLFGTRNQIPYWHDSVTLFSHALAVTGRNPMALVNLGAGNWDQNEYGKAMAFYRAALKMDPANADAAKGIAVMYVMEGKPDLALALFEQIIHYRPLYGNAYLGAGVILSNFGRDSEAIRMLEQGVKLEPGSDDGWYHLGLLYIRNNRAIEAAECFKRTLAILPERTDAKMNLAAAYQIAGHPDLADATFNEALRTAPTYPGLQNAYGLFLVQQARIEPALQHLLAAIQLNQGDARTFLYAGLIRASQHRDSEAVSFLRTALRMQPGDPSGTRGLAWILATSQEAKLRDGAQAVRLAESLAKNAPEEPKVLDLLAAAQAETGEYEQAQRTAERAIELSQKAGEVQFAEAIQRRLEAYRGGKAWREAGR